MSKKRKTSKKRKRSASGKARRTRLSLVMMAKDEEENLPRALQSAAPWVDEIVLVDTGSKDRTMDIAREFGARIYQHPWQNDFSLHRNQALSYAKGDWCLQLDADEELDQATAPLIKGLIGKGTADAFWLEMYNIVAGQPGSLVYLLRLFKNTPEAKYSQRMHNQLSVPGRHSPCGVRFYHYGYDGRPEVMAQKHARRLEMMKRWLADEPDNWMVHYRMAQTLALQPIPGGPDSQERKEALQALAFHGLKALELAKADKADPQAYMVIFPQLTEALSLLKHDGQLEGVLEKWASISPRNIDLWYFQTEYRLRKHDWEEVARSARQYFKMRESLSSFMQKHPIMEVNTATRQNPVYVAWLLAEAKLGHTGRALQVLKRLAREPGAEAAAQAAVARMLRHGLRETAALVATEANRLAPAWQWPRQVLNQGGRP